MADEVLEGLREAIRRSGTPQHTLAEVAGTGRVNVCRFVGRHQGLSFEVALKLANALRFDLQPHLHREDED